MLFNREKFQALVLYIIWRAGDQEGFGATKLNKVLWFADARTFEAFGSSITGETYKKDKFGPVPVHAREVCEELELAGAIETWTEHVYDYHIKRFRAFQPPDTTMFKPEELSFVDWWIRHVAQNHTAKSISERSHDRAWHAAKIGEELPLYAYLTARIRDPSTSEELEWLEREASSLGLK